MPSFHSREGSMRGLEAGMRRNAFIESPAQSLSELPLMCVFDVENTVSPK